MGRRHRKEVEMWGQRIRVYKQVHSSGHRHAVAPGVADVLGSAGRCRLDGGCRQ